MRGGRSNPAALFVPGAQGANDRPTCEQRRHGQAFYVAKWDINGRESRCG